MVIEGGWKVGRDTYVVCDVEVGTLVHQDLDRLRMAHMGGIQQGRHPNLYRAMARNS